MLLRRLRKMLLTILRLAEVEPAGRGEHFNVCWMTRVEQNFAFLVLAGARKFGRARYGASAWLEGRPRHSLTLLACV